MQHILSFDPEYERFIQYYKDVTTYEAEFIRDYWRPLWKNPEEFKDTDLIEIVLSWIRVKTRREWAVYSWDTKEWLGSVGLEIDIDKYKAQYRADAEYGKGKTYVTLRERG